MSWWSSVAIFGCIMYFGLSGLLIFITSHVALKFGKKQMTAIRKRKG